MVVMNLLKLTLFSMRKLIKLNKMHNYLMFMSLKLKTH